MARGSVTAALILLFAATLSAERKDVTITADDGFPLKATWQSAGKSGPGVLLLHHAASMFSKEPGLEADIVIWFRRNLPVAGYATLPSAR